MKTSNNLGMQLPEGTDDVLIDVLTDALNKVDTAVKPVAGNGISISINATSKVPTVTHTPEQSLNASLTTNSPSSKAVADFVAAQVSGSGTYRGQYDLYGTLAQIKAQTPVAGKTGVYLSGGQVYIITSTASWPANGVIGGSQVSGDTYDIKGILDAPATGGGFESGSIRYVKRTPVTDSTFAVTGVSSAVKTVSAGSGISVNSADPFNPVVSLPLGEIGTGNTTNAVSGSVINTALDTKQARLVGSSDTAVLYGATAGAVKSRSIVNAITGETNSLVTEKAVSDALETLEGEKWVVSFASTQPTAIAGEKILWLKV